jgi:trans-feruloyl-CoA hydratase/vanillin synthase
MVEYSAIDVSVEDDVGTLTFDRPEKKNAMNPRLLEEMGDALGDLRDEVHVLVVTGAGDAFNAGMDFDEYFEAARAAGPLAVREANRLHKRALVRLYEFPAPTVAKVNGWALGGGYMAMSLCDLAIGSEDAKLGLSEINFGIAAGGGTMWSVAHTMNRRDALYYTMTGEPFTCAEAVEMGVINEAVPASELDGRVDGLVDRLRQKDRFALEYTRHYYDKVVEMDFPEAHDYELAKGEEMKYLQGYEFLDRGVSGFTQDRYRPGAGEDYPEDE